ARPYAGYLAFGAFVQRASEDVHDHLELSVGVVGEWSGAEATQKFIHAAFPNQDEPLGWGTQLSNELAVNLRYQRSWRFRKAQIGSLQLDGIPRLGFDAGNVFVRANADITFRLGYNLPDDFGPGRLLDYADVTGSWGGDWGVYAYVRGGARAVARNIFLDGNTFAGSRSVDKRPVVASITAGFMGRYHHLEAGWSVTWLSEEFDTQGNGDSFGTLFARLSFPF
ncbi:MAG: lipid A deacylase LpxR family protein, partial [Phycisphaerales bacterium JB059]